MSFNFKYISNYDVSKIKDKVLNFSEELWNSYTFRQDRHGVHKYTTTVPIIWKEPLNRNVQISDTEKYWSEFESIKNDLNNIDDILRKNLCDGSIESVLLIRLPKNKSIAKHKDRGRYFNNHNRIHIPIVTHHDIIFEISDERKNLKEGEIWEINNNDKSHGVYNNSNVDRVHLLLDWNPNNNDVF